MVARKRTIVGKPSKLGGIHDVSDYNSVLLGLDTGPSVHDGVGKPTELTHDILVAAARNQVIVSSNQDNIHRPPSVGFGYIIYNKSISKGINISTRNGDIVDMKSVALVHFGAG